jgi:hypothetical protein
MKANDIENRLIGFTAKIGKWVFIDSLDSRKLMYFYDEGKINDQDLIDLITFQYKPKNEHDDLEFPHTYIQIEGEIIVDPNNKNHINTYYVHNKILIDIVNNCSFHKSINIELLFKYLISYFEKNKENRWDIARYYYPAILRLDNIMLMINNKLIYREIMECIRSIKYFIDNNKELINPAVNIYITNLEKVTCSYLSVCKECSSLQCENCFFSTLHTSIFNTLSKWNKE